ncbi:MAG: tRNA (adenosine(37)-N6)-threonylcarbamoyltransferase complex dimerization subunit type 1 TsaB [Anaerolineae bacterium]|nr:tRNA (adenosine(37)-N6)-threonylcarbamoyltransferase complex dimerization subunit type 1 TsaB [Anaerolineae bacterium]
MGMLIAIDTATEYASLALHDGTRVLVEHTWESPRHHTVELAPRLVAALKQARAESGALSGIAVTRGPGSFTGLRVGMALAKGLALARGLPLVGIPTLDVLAAAQGQDERPLCAVLQAGRGRIGVAFYRWRNGAWHQEDELRLTTWPALVNGLHSPTLVCGEIDGGGMEVLASSGGLAVVLPAATRLRRAGFLAELAWQRLSRGEHDDPATLVPIYLQHPV